MVHHEYFRQRKSPILRYPKATNLRIISVMMMVECNCTVYNSVTCFLLAEVRVIVLVELAVGLIAIVSGFGYRHTYIVSSGNYTI